MATEIERAIIELQVLYRGMHQRVTAIERGQPAKPTAPPPPEDVPVPQSHKPPENPPDSSPPPPPPPPAHVEIPAPTALKPAPIPTDHEFTFSNYNARVQAALKQISRRNRPLDGSVENIIGQSVVSFVGALALFAGIVLFLRFPFHQSWLQPGQRVIDGLIAGAALLVAGQWLHHLRMKPLAAAITAAGLATLAAAFFAANIAYVPAVLPHTAAFAGLALVCAIGIALAFQMRMQSLAALGLSGMYLTPLILNAGEDDPLFLFAYLAIVTAAALTICFYRRRWYWLRAVSLFALLVPFYFPSLLATDAWLLTSFALALYALLTGSVNSRAGMFIILALFGGRILFVDSTDPILASPLITLPNLAIIPWMILAAAGAFFTLVLAWLISSQPIITPKNYRRPNSAIIGCIIVGSILWFVFVGTTLEPFQLATFASLVWIFALILLGRLLFTDQDAPLLETIAAALLTATCVKWIIFDGLSGALTSPIKTPPFPGTHTILPPLANLYVLNGILILLAFRATRILRLLGRPFFGWLITALAFIALNLELLRSVDLALRAPHTPPVDPWLIKNLSVSIFCALYALGISIFGFARKYPPARWVALLLFAATVLKVLLIDMANVDNSLRMLSILSFLLIGLLLLTVSFLYHRTNRPPAIQTA